ncbi:MAG TPA: tetratricopeptide repeat protein [Bacteroidales bacterium]|nr:tetratricopeptide repeat protein [Bacteroidales bacterium]
MKTIDFSYYIERYIANEMSDAEKLWFEKELEGNEKLNKEVELRKKADEILKDKDILSLRNKLSAIEKQRSEAPLKARSAKGYVKYAAVAGVAIILGIFLILPGKKLTTGEIMDRYYKIYEPPTTQRSARVIINDDFNQALEFYRTNDFKNAAVYFKKVISLEPKDMYSTLLFGISKFEDQKFPEAKTSFNKVIDDRNNLYIDQAEWYLALCYLNTDEKSKALRLFEKIKKENGIYKDDAKAIIRDLK